MGTQRRKDKLYRELARIVRVLRAITLGQGTVYISVTADSACDGFVNGAFEVIWERDGKIGTVEVFHDVDNFVAQITDGLDSAYQDDLVSRSVIKEARYR